MQTQHPLIAVAPAHKLTIGPKGTTVVLTRCPQGRVRDAWGRVISLVEGMHLWLYLRETNEVGIRDDLLLDGSAHSVRGTDQWIVHIENKQVRRHSDIAPDERHWANSVDWDELVHREQLPARRGRRFVALLARLRKAIRRRRRSSASPLVSKL